MSQITRRWCLLAIAGAPIVLGITAQALSVRVDHDSLRISAPNLDFLKDKPLDRLKDGRTVFYLAQLSVETGDERTLQGHSFAHFAISHDVFEDMNAGFTVTLMTPGLKKGEKPPSAKNLSAAATQAWCLDQLTIKLAQIPTGRPIWVRLEVRSEDPKESAGIIGEPGISITGLIELFSHPVKNKEVHLVEESGPFNISDLRKAHL